MFVIDYWTWIALLGIAALWLWFVASNGEGVSHTLVVVFISSLALSTIQV